MIRPPQAPGRDANANEARPWSPGVVPLREHIVRVEFDQSVSDDFAEGLEGNSRRRLFDLLPQVSTNAAGRVELRLIVPGPDLWTSLLTAMSVVTQAGYQAVAVQAAAATSA